MDEELDVRCISFDGPAGGRNGMLEVAAPIPASAHLHGGMKASAVEQDQRQVIRLWAPGVERLGFLRKALSAAGIEAQPLGEATFREVYFDTDDDLLYRAGAACVMRVLGEDASVEAQSLSSVMMPDAHLPKESVPISACGAPESPPGTLVAQWLDTFLAGAPLKPRLELHGRRATFLLRLSEGAACELSTGAFQEKGSAASLAEVEISYPPGLEAAVRKAVKALRTKLDLSAAEDHRLTLWRKVAQAGAPKLTEAEDLTLRREDRFVDAAWRVPRRHLGRMLWHEPGARLGIDPEHLHDMRVATRRLRAALQVFAPALPQRKAAAFEKQLRWLADALGEVRDLDVQLMAFEEETREIPAESAALLSPYRRHLLRQYDQARRRMLRKLATRRYARLVSRFNAFLEAGPPRSPAAKEARAPVASAGREIIRGHLGKVLRAGKGAFEQRTPILLHRLRIRCKRLRYACEFFEDLYGKPARRFAQRVTALQDILGRHHDAIVAQQALTGLAHRLSAPRGHGRDFALAMGLLMQIQRARAVQAEQEFLKEWRKFVRPKTRRDLERRMASR
jgi:CHAD domain-containing protein